VKWWDLLTLLHSVPYQKTRILWAVFFIRYEDLHLFPVVALFMNTGKIVFLEMRPANAELPFSLVASPGILSNLLVDNTSKTNVCAQRKETLSELVGPLMNVS